MEKLLEYIARFFNYIIKGFIGLPALIIPIAFGVHSEAIVHALVVLIVVDTILGVWKGISGVVEEKASSNKLRQFINKIISYGAAVIVGFQIEKVLLYKGIHFNVKGFGLCEIIMIGEGITEILSIIENLGQLGFKVPKILAKHLEVLKDFEIKKK